MAVGQRLQKRPLRYSMSATEALDRVGVHRHDLAGSREDAIAMSSGVHVGAYRTPGRFLDRDPISCSTRPQRLLFLVGQLISDGGRR